MPAACLFSYTIMIYLKRLHRTNSLNTKQCPVGLSTRIIPQVSPFLPKCPLLWWCFVVPVRCGLSPFPLNLYWKPWRWGEIITQQPKIYYFPPPEKSLLVDLHLLLSKVSILPHQISIFMQSHYGSFICSCSHFCCTIFFNVRLYAMPYQFWLINVCWMLYLAWQKQWMVKALPSKNPTPVWISWLVS